MDNLESKPTIASTADSSDLAQQVESLRQLIISALVLVIVISGTFNIYLWRQVKYTRADLVAFRPQATQMVAEYERISAPVMRDFLIKLNEFAKSPRSDEGFAALVKKYGIANIPGLTNAIPVPVPAAPATATGAPAAAPKKK